ncbi:hypothetical protein NLG97_g3099 [Lecanicillium saksenae]|uniref:Uncharacterized protein n=1 Tax=Lecanicillium saksenae TaxID=468837 RepID=A0ACC1R0U8_9HYPO|nr:hypothetical protein NLG97_g3099 [Lecanicillium saksenae]
MQAPIRRSESAPSGLEYHVYTPTGMAKYLEQQKLKPEHLRDFYCLDQSHRSITEYCPGFGSGPNAPRNRGRIFISEGPADADVKRCTAANAVDSTEELLGSDRPHATIQVTRFSDATIITMSVTHAFGDLVTLKAYFKKWEDALHGRPIQPFEHEGVDPFAEYGPEGEFGKAARMGRPPNPPPGWHVFGLVDKMRFLKRYLWDYYVLRPEKTIRSRRIFIPESQVTALEDRARHDLCSSQKTTESAPGSTDLKGKPPFVSRSDVIYAWLLKHSHADLPPSQPSTALFISNGRFRPPAPLKAGTAGLSDNDLLCAAMAITLPSFTAGDVMSMSLGELALHIRKGIKANASPEHIKTWLMFQLFHFGWKSPSGQTIVPCEPHHFVTGVTDWSQLHLEQLDFTPARLNTNVVGTVVPSVIDGHMLVQSSRRDFYICLGDVDGGTWILGYASDKQWSDPKNYGMYDAVQHTPRSKL